ncbi:MULTISPECIES: hypothetical protein [unclassified Chelatococcus]|uniref:hypothetical protein n=1 Tax=unclassified Chelatococcus TaxID=2638111 RepID=UPI001BCDE11E|nr:MULTISPECIES: hypothetical protein [unclassified Chelatococcus]MBS7701178.1 hypothetical protein [Chelatococcus sp. YT9]MBX3557309.1 hypothetical protein [Chelatococcus sp.]
MTRGNFKDFINELGSFLSANHYNAVDVNTRLGRYALDEADLTGIDVVRRDGDSGNNDYSGGWVGKYGIKSRDQFLRSPEAQDKAILEVLEKRADFFHVFKHSDGQTISGQEISFSGIIGASFLTDASHILSSLSNLHGPSNDASSAWLREGFVRFGGYEVPYVDQERGHTFVGSDQADVIRAHGGKDRFVARDGDDEFHGGEDEDTLVLPRNRSEYTITSEPFQATGPASPTWHIKRSLSNGADEHKEIQNVEMIEFADGEVIDLRHILQAALEQEPTPLIDVHLSTGAQDAVDVPAIPIASSGVPAPTALVLADAETPGFQSVAPSI